ncbi:MAG: DciA family protein [Actinomycetota bacterium]
MDDEPLRLKDVLADATKRLGIPSPEATGRVWARWNDVVGPDVAAHAEPTSLRAGVLRVRADSPAWATEIGYLAAEIRSRVNAVTGLPLVKEVRVWTGPRPARAHVPAARSDAAGEPADGAARERPADPAEALERARRAWARRRS